MKDLLCWLDLLCRLEQIRAESRMILGLLPERLTTAQPPIRGRTVAEMRQLGIYPKALMVKE